ncbi:MAG: TolC family protein [Verrucomicrobiota bacterium]
MAALIPSHVPAQTLSKAAWLTLQHEPEIQAANFDRLSSEQDWKTVRGDLRPQLTMEGRSGYVERDRSTDGLVSSSGNGLLSRQIGLSVRQLLFDGGLARNQSRSAKQALEVQTFVQRSMVEARIVDLAEVYLEVLRAERQVNEAREQVTLHREIRDMIEETVGRGGNRADLALVEGRLSLAVETEASQDLALENARARFLRLTGQRPMGLTHPQVPSIPESESGILLEQNWDYQAAIAALEAAMFKHRSAKGRHLPKVYLDAGGSVGEDVLGVEGEDNELRALVVLSWDLFRGGANRALVEREHFQVQKAEELVRAAIEHSEYQRILLWKERENSKSSVRTLGSYVANLEGVLADYREQFKLGKRDLLNILDVQDELYTAEAKRTDARYNVDTTAFRLAGLQGTLTDSLIGAQAVQAYMEGRSEADAGVSVDADPISSPITSTATAAEAR